MLKKNLISFFIVTAVFTLDRFSKYIILSLSEPLGELNISITSFLNFNLIWNEELQNDEKMKFNKNVRSWLTFQLESDGFEIRSNIE